MKKRLLALALAAAMLACFLPMGAAVDRQVTIVGNPYRDVNWDTCTPYKAEMHAHSTVSDGYDDFDVMVEAYYEQDYDVLAMSEHGAVDRGWTKLNVPPLLQFFQQIDKPSDFFPTSTGLTEQRFQEISTGADRGGRGMLRVPHAIELNPTSLNKAHVNSWFSDWGNAYLGGSFDYEVAVRGVNGAGGLCSINHPSDSSLNDKKTPEDAYEGFLGTYTTFKIQRLFERYPALIAIEMRETQDRKLWDKLLTNLAPAGRNVFGLLTGDEHRATGVAGQRHTLIFMEENTTENLRASLEAGAFIAAMPNRRSEAPAPVVTGITAQAGTIAIEAGHADAIRWISDGAVVATGAEIDLTACEGLGAYVRAEVQGEGGTLYTQPFLLSYEGMPAGNPVPWYFVDFGFIPALFRQLFFFPIAFIIDQISLLR